MKSHLFFEYANDVINQREFKETVAANFKDDVFGHISPNGQVGKFFLEIF